MNEQLGTGHRDKDATAIIEDDPVADYAARLVAEAPALSSEQRDLLAALLRPDHRPAIRRLA